MTVLVEMKRPLPYFQHWRTLTSALEVPQKVGWLYLRIFSARASTKLHVSKEVNTFNSLGQSRVPTSCSKSGMA